MNIGYARISTSHQDMERQLQELTAFPCERVYQDTISGALNGQQLTVMLDHLRKDDVVVVSELSRLGRNMRHLLEVVEKVNNAGAAIHSIKEGPVNTNTAMGRTFFYLLGMFAEMEREYNRERTMHGLAVARARGRLGGRPGIPEADMKKALKLYDEKTYTIKEIEKLTGVSRSSLYRRLKG